MTTERNRQRRVSYAQLEALWEALTRNRSLATGLNKTAQARDAYKRMWNTIALDLNSFGDGAIKDRKGWSKYWNDYKSKLKNRVAVLRVSHQRTGGGQAKEKELTEIEEKFLQILGEGFSAGLPGVRVEPFEVPTDVHLQEVVDSGHSESILLQDIPSQQDARALTPQPGPSRRLYETPETVETQPLTQHTPRHPPRTPRHTQHTPQHTLRTPQHTLRTPQHTTRTPRRGHGPRRRINTNPPMMMEMARRNLVAASQLKNQIAERAARRISAGIQGI